MVKKGHYVDRRWMGMTPEAESFIKLNGKEIT